MVPTLFRDSQVLTIWEGTTNVLCHDFVRAVKKEKSTLEVFNMVFIRILNDCTLAEGKVIYQNSQVRDSYVKFMNSHINNMNEIRKMQNHDDYLLK